MSTTIEWHKSSYSANGANCVEVAEGPVTGVRDTQNRELGHLAVPAPEWAALVSAVRGL
ncbi:MULTISPECIES: DUF397 domain-containing protein [Nocardiopsidaceae]|uniref:DUF397 domain-containing protein n=2 Tax=Nocardiopsidaceae TaxID=83676 RepID=A0ABY6YTX0_9ACTN|nr:DUF397 domain-containing protein [Streptomonospora nanhaiensis]MEE2042558.1 DUF397 domain-containing protein [Nocardiopsis tropica]WAE75848.1 DUF397 domain-containing protein [Streptomonospora nanhaiensis]